MDESCEGAAMTLLLAAAGGSLGAVARYLVDFWVASRGISRVPFATPIVNVSGSLALGVLMGAIGVAGATGAGGEVAGAVGGAVGGATAGGPEWLVAFAGAGFLAAYTTFSTWMFEVVRLTQRGAHLTAALHVLGTIVPGVIAAALGLAAGAMLVG
jgi:fluoride exporter